MAETQPTRVLILGHSFIHRLKSFQGHPTEHFGNISVRMEGCLKISNFFHSGCSRLFKFFGKPYRFPFTDWQPPRDKNRAHKTILVAFYISVDYASDGVSAFGTGAD